MSRRLALTSCSALLFAACTVEPRVLPVIEVDAGTRDAAEEDSGPQPRECADGEACGANEYCFENRCTPIPVQCEDSDECAPGYRCSNARCVVPRGSCASNADCAAPEVCTALGWCAPEMVAYAPQVSACTQASDCGPGGVCTSGFCDRCADDDDCGGLACVFGACVERAPCASSSECYPGNTCASMSCRRSTAACSSDGENDVSSGATPLEERLYTERTICGDDRDWYSIVVPQDTGATVVITSTRALSTISAYAEDDQGMVIDGAASLSLPGITMIAVPVGVVERTVRVLVEGNDASGDYAIDVRRLVGLCAGDGLDLYGDRDPATAPFVVPGVLSLRLCNGDEDVVRLAAEAGDTFAITASFADSQGADLDLELLDAAGVVIAAGRSTSTSTEAVSSGAIGSAQALALRVTTKRAPSAGAAYTLTIQRVRGTRLEACANAPVLDASNTFAAGTLSGRTDLGVSPDFFCAAFARNDAIYRIDPPSADAVLAVTVRQVSGTPTSTLTLSLLAECDSDLSELVCDSAPRAGRDARLIRQLTSADPVYLMISSFGEAEDVGFEVDITLEDPGVPVNDQCTAATPLSGSTEVPASTFGAADDARCTDQIGPDRFYTLSLAARERAAIELRGPLGGALWLATDCMQLTSTCTVADAIEAGHPATVLLQPSRATNYIVAVDGVGAATAGAYELRTVRAPDLECFADSECTPLRCDDYRCVGVPANDACPGEDVVFTNNRAVVRASTGGANDDFAPSCSPQRSQADVAYRVTVPAGISALTARITEADWDPVMMIRSPGCADAASELACADDVRYPDLILPELELPNPNPGTYTIIVDAYSGRGPFTLEIELVE